MSLLCHSPSGFSALIMRYNVFFLSYCGVCKPVEYVCPL